MGYVWDSQILSASCNVLSGSNTITSYSNSNRTRKTWIRSGSSWYLYQTSTNNNGYNLDGYNCFDVSTLTYEYDYIYPVYEFISFCLIGFALILIYKVIIRRLLP